MIKLYDFNNIKKLIDIFENIKQKNNDEELYILINTIIKISKELENEFKIEESTIISFKDDKLITLAKEFISKNIININESIIISPEMIEIINILKNIFEIKKDYIDKLEYLEIYILINTIIQLIKDLEKENKENIEYMDIKHRPLVFYDNQLNIVLERNNELNFNKFPIDFTVKVVYTTKEEDRLYYNLTGPKNEYGYTYFIQAYTYFRKEKSINIWLSSNEAVHIQDELDKYNNLDIHD